MKGEALKGHLDLILLAALEEGPAYGYSLAANIATATNGQVKLSDGTIYPALHRLERAGFLTSRREISQGRQLRVYSLTDRGTRELTRLRQEWSAFARGVSHLLERTT